MRGQFLGLLSGLRIQHCHELRCRSQILLGSGVAVAVVQVSSCSSDSTPGLETSICHGCGPKKKKKCKVISLEHLVLCFSFLTIAVNDVFFK